MTLIAGYTIRHVPCLIGDIVISSPKPPNNPITLPTSDFSSTSLLENREHYISDTQQKLHIINDQFCLAWSGSVIHAKMIVNDLTELSNGSEKLRTKVISYFDELDKSGDGNETSIIGWLVEDGYQHSLSYRATGFNTETFGPLAAAGTGAQHFLAYAASQDGEEKLYKQHCPPSTNAAIFSNAAIGELLFHEYHNPISLENGYGGGYEHIQYTDGKFQKYADTTFYRSNVLLTKDSYKPYPLIFMKYDYVGDLLRIHYCNWRDGSGKLNKILIRPIDKYKANYSAEDLDSAYKKPVDLNSQWLTCNNSYKFKTNDYILDLNSTQDAPTEHHIANFSTSDNELRIHYTDHSIAKARTMITEDIALNIMGKSPIDRKLFFHDPLFEEL